MIPTVNSPLSVLPPAGDAFPATGIFRAYSPTIHPGAGKDAAVGQFAGDSSKTVSGRTVVRKQPALRQVKSEASLSSERAAFEASQSSVQTALLEQHVEGLEHQLAELDASVTALKADKEALSSELGSANNQMTGLTRAVDELGTRLGDADGRLEAAGKYAQQMKTELKSVNNQKAGLERTVGELRGQLDDANRELEAATREAQQIKTDSKSVNDQKAKLGKRVGELQRLLGDARRKLQAATKNAEQTETKHKALNDAFACVEAAKEALQQELSERDHTLAHTQRQLAVAKNLIDTLKTELNSVKAEKATFQAAELETMQALRTELMADSRYVNQWVLRAVYVLTALLVVVVLKNVQLRQARSDQ
jgi:chromosome segregation ATPase